MLQNFGVDRGFGALATAGIPHIVHIVCRDIGAKHVVDEPVGIVEILRIGRDGEMIKPQIRALFRDVIFDDMSVLGFLGAIGGLERVARPHDRGADITIRDVIDRLAGMDIAKMWLDRVQYLAGSLEIPGVGAGAVTTHIGDDIRQHIGRRVKDDHTAILQLRGILRVEDQRPAVGRRVGAETFLDHRRIIGDSGCPPHIDGTGIVDPDLVVGETLHLHVLAAVIAKPCQIEILIGTGLAAAGEEVTCRHDNIVA